MLQSNDLTFSYSNQSALSFPDIHIGKGNHSLILGQSGCGKSTLLHILAGIRTPDSGQVRIDGNDLSSFSSSQLDKFRGQNIGLIFQNSYFVRSLSIQDNLLLAQKLAGVQLDIDAVDDLLRRLYIQDKKQRYSSQLSAGEQQRAAIARALINRPKIILADEPTSALDDKNTDAVIDLLIEQSDMHNSTLIVVTHDKRLKDRFNQKIEL